MIVFENLTLRRGPRVLIEQVHFTLHAGQRVGLTGHNGCGKSSLFALLLGTLESDAGQVTVPPSLCLAHVAQHVPATERSALDYVLDGDVELRAVQHALQLAEQQGDGLALAHGHESLQHIGGYEAESRAARLLHGLGFQPGQEQQSVQQFSGGWRMRLNLAQALMCRSDVLLLDEPTNHLDLDAILWLENWLSSYQGTLLLIAHDRDFLNRTVNHIAHIEQQRLTLYRGNYDDFERMRASHLASQQSEHERQQRHIAHMQSYVARFRAKATKARQAQSRLKALERMTLIAPVHADNPFRFNFRAPEALPNPLLRLRQVATGYADSPCLSDINLSLVPGDRIGLLGINGAGKSTFIKLLAGELGAQQGELTTAKDLRVGYFAQHQLEQLDPNSTPLQHIMQISGGKTEQVLRNFLGSFGFQDELMTRSVAPFSGGEKARLALALLLWKRPNLLLLDEPTNHLDLDMRMALNLALQDYTGAVLLVSHDRHLLRTACDQLLLVDNGAVRPFAGDLDDYPTWLQQRRKKPAKQATPRTQESKKKPTLSHNARKQRRNRQKSLEQKIEQLTQQLHTTDQRIADPQHYVTDADPQTLKRLHDEQSSIKQKLAKAEEEWLEIAE